VCIAALGLAAAGAAPVTRAGAPGQPAQEPGRQEGDDALWRWEDGQGGLHYSRGDEIPEASRAKATRVDALLGTVSKDRTPDDAAPGPRPRAPTAPRPLGGGPLPTVRCGPLEALRRLEVEPGLVEVRPGIAERVESSDYLVAGATPIQIRQDLDKRRPGSHDAHTRWWVNWRFPRDPAGGASCRLGRPSVDLRVMHMMPRLGPTAGRDGVVETQWAAYLGHLRRHEAGHRAVGAAAANDVLEALVGFAGGPCAAESAANACAGSIIAEHMRLEAQYDGRTRHGMADGAVFP